MPGDLNVPRTYIPAFSALQGRILPKKGNSSSSTKNAGCYGGYGTVHKFHHSISFNFIPDPKKEFSRNQKNDYARQQGPGFFAFYWETLISRNAGHVTGNRAAPAENPLS